MEYTYKNQAGKPAYTLSYGVTAQLRVGAEERVEKELSTFSGWIPYRLDKAFSCDRIVIARTEEEADRLSAAGHAATAVPLGYSNWQQAWGKLFKDKHVTVLLADGLTGHLETSIVFSCVYDSGASAVVKLNPDAPVENFTSDGYYMPGVVTRLVGAPLSTAGSHGTLVWISRVRSLMRQYTFSEAETLLLAAHFEALTRDSLKLMPRNHLRVQMLKEWAFFRLLVRGDRAAAAVILAEALTLLNALEADGVPYPVDPHYNYVTDRALINKYLAKTTVVPASNDSSLLPREFGRLESSISEYYKVKSRDYHKLNVSPNKLPRSSVLVTIPFKVTHGAGLSDLRIVLDSLQKQTYRGNVEAFVSEGSAVDSARELCLKMGAHYEHNPVVEFHGSKLRNVGPSRVRSAEWLMWIDQDIVLHPRYVEYALSRLVPRYTKKPVEHVLLHCFRLDDGNMRGVADFRNRNFFWKEFVMSVMSVTWHCMIGNNLITHQSTNDLVGGWWEEMKHWGHEDLEYGARAAEHGVQLEVSIMPLTYHLQHKGTAYRKDLFRQNLRLMHARHPGIFSAKERADMLSWGRS